MESFTSKTIHTEPKHPIATTMHNFKLSTTKYLLEKYKPKEIYNFNSINNKDLKSEA